MSDYTPSFGPADVQALKPVRRAAAKARRAEESALRARDELAYAVQAAHRRDGFSVRELGFVLDLSTTATHALIRRVTGGKR